MDSFSTLLTSTFGIFLVGVALRWARVLPESAPQTLNRVVTHATMPALSLTVLARGRVSFEVAEAIVVTLAALCAALVCSWLLSRALRLGPQARGSVLLTGSFANTGFLGIPVVLAVFPNDTRAGAAAVLINIVDATLLLWTLGVVIAARHGTNESKPAASEIARTLAGQPLLWGVTLGLALSMSGVSLPPWLDAPLTLLGQATSVLVFLSLGLGLSLRGLRSHVAPIVGATTIKLMLAPLVAWLVARALGLDPVIADVAVLQAAMPTALVSVIIAREQGCDPVLATATAAVTTSLALFSLPVVIAALMT